MLYGNKQAYWLQPDPVSGPPRGVGSDAVADSVDTGIGQAWHTSLATEEDGSARGPGLLQSPKQLSKRMVGSWQPRGGKDDQCWCGESLAKEAEASPRSSPHQRPHVGTQGLPCCLQASLSAFYWEPHY